MHSVSTRFRVAFTKIRSGDAIPNIDKLNTTAIRRLIEAMDTRGWTAVWAEHRKHGKLSVMLHVFGNGFDQLVTAVLGDEASARPEAMKGADVVETMNILCLAVLASGVRHLNNTVPIKHEPVLDAARLARAKGYTLSWDCREVPEAVNLMGHVPPRRFDVRVRAVPDDASATELSSIHRVQMSDDISNVIVDIANSVSERLAYV